MSYIPSQNNQVNKKYDYDKDGDLDHDDVTCKIHDLDNGGRVSASTLLGMQKAGCDVNAQDLKDFLDAGGNLNGSDIARFVDQGGTLTKDDVAHFMGAGVEFTDAELSAIEKKLGIDHVSKFPPGTTPNDLLDMAKDGVTVSAHDMMSLKGPDGKPLATGQDMERLLANGGKVTGKDLIALQKANGKVTGDDLVWFVKHGGKLTGQDLVNLTNNGTVIYANDLKEICDKGKVGLTSSQYLAIDPVGGDGKTYSQAHQV